MSRVGKKPIPISGKTKVTLNDRQLTVQGPKGSLSRALPPDVQLTIEADAMHVAVAGGGKQARAVQGLMRSLVANMVIGVDRGFQRVLEINGIGYRAALAGDTLTLNLGYSHPIDFKLPEGISASVDKNNTITLSGIDKEQLGLTAASIRRLRGPEPYKGKGIKFAEEKIQRKAGKTGTK
jgi:large subunit ribosomal protein L6